MSKTQQIIDLRTPDAFRNGTLAGAQNVPLRRLQMHLHSLDRSTPLVLVDDDGTISSPAMNFAMGMGFANVTVKRVK